MIKKKKRLLLLCAIPAYFLHCLLPVLMYSDGFKIGNFVSFSAFVISAEAVFILKNKPLKIICLVITHLFFAAAVFFGTEFFGLTYNHFIIYCIYCLPSLLIIDGIEKSTNNLDKSKEKTKADQIKYSTFFDFLILALMVVLLISFIIGKETVNFKFDATSIYLISFLVIVLFCFLMLSFNKSFKKSNFQIFVLNVLICCIVDCLVYVFWAHIYVYDKVYLLFPVCLVFIIINTYFLD